MIGFLEIYRLDINSNNNNNNNNNNNLITCKAHVPFEYVHMRY